MASDRAKEITRRFDRLKGDRGTFEAHWQQVADFCHPERSEYVTQKSPGQKRMQHIYDATPVLALEQFAAGLHSLLTSPSLRWFTLRCEDERLNANQRVQLWLEDTSERMYAIFNGPKHNFASQSNELYLDIGSIGTAVMAVIESVRSGILFSTRHMRECVIAENEEDRVDTLIRKWSFTAQQAVEAWPKSPRCPCGPGEKVLAALENNPDKKFMFMHAVRPRLDRNPDRGGETQHMEWESVYLSCEDMEEISVGGFPEFPYLVPRFSKITGEIYGRGPGMMALPDIKMLNEMMRTVLKAAQKVIDPPLDLPDQGYIMPIRTEAGSLNYHRRSLNPNDRILPIKTDGNVNLGIELLNSIRQQIIRAFYVDYMLMPSDQSDPASSGKGVTATYVLQQRDEKMRLMSPMLARLQSEFLSPLIDRVFAMLFRKSLAVRFRPDAPLMAPPPELSGVALRVEYVSPIAVAQKSSEMEQIMRLIQLTESLIPINQNAGAVLDTDQIVRVGGRILNSPPSIIKTPERLQQEQQQQQQAEQAMQQHMQLESMAGSAKDATGAVKNLADAHAAVQGAGGGPVQEAA